MREHLHTPWSDEIGLVEFDTAQDSEGYLLPAQPPMRTVFGTWEDGVSQSEFYSSMKAGLQANASVEIWTADYESERFVFFRKRFYRVLRAFQSAFDYTTLILQEVIR